MYLTHTRIEKRSVKVAVVMEFYVIDMKTLVATIIRRFRNHKKHKRGVEGALKYGVYRNVQGPNITICRSGVWTA